jgi:hypothetical protein
MTLTPYPNIRSIIKRVEEEQDGRGQAPAHKVVAPAYKVVAPACWVGLVGGSALPRAAFAGRQDRGESEHREQQGGRGRRGGVGSR